MARSPAKNKTPSQIAWSIYLDSVHNYAHAESIFTPEECEKIVRISKKYEMFPGITISNDPEIRSIRKVKTAALDAVELRWVFERLTGIIVSMNEQFFEFDIWGLGEGINFLEYENIGDKYDSHIDKIYGSLVRKLTVIVQLTDPKKYTGCDLEVVYCGDNGKVTMTREQGSVIVFPSYVVHQVTPLKKGKRHSLVSWVSGKPFK